MYIYIYITNKLYIIYWFLRILRSRLGRNRFVPDIGVFLHFFWHCRLTGFSWVAEWKLSFLQGVIPVVLIGGPCNLDETVPKLWCWQPRFFRPILGRQSGNGQTKIELESTPPLMVCGHDPSHCYPWGIGPSNRSMDLQGRPARSMCLKQKRTLQGQLACLADHWPIEHHASHLGLSGNWVYYSQW